MFDHRLFNKGVGFDYVETVGIRLADLREGPECGIMVAIGGVLLRRHFGPSTDRDKDHARRHGVAG